MGQYQLYILLTVLSFIVNVVLGTVSLTIVFTAAAEARVASFRFVTTARISHSP